MRWLAVVAVLLITGCASAPAPRPGLWLGIGLGVAAGLVIEDSRDDSGPCVDFSNCQQP